MFKTMVLFFYFSSLCASDFITFEEYRENNSQKIRAVSHFSIHKIRVIKHAGNARFIVEATPDENNFKNGFYYVSLPQYMNFNNGNRRNVTLDLLKDQNTEIDINFAENQPVSIVRFLTKKKKKFALKNSLREDFIIDYELTNEGKIFEIISPINIPYISMRFQDLKFTKDNHKKTYTVYFLHNDANPNTFTTKFLNLPNTSYFNTLFARNRANDYLFKLNVEHLIKDIEGELAPNHFNGWQISPNHVFFEINKAQLRNLKRDHSSKAPSERQSNEPAYLLKQIRLQELGEETYSSEATGDDSFDHDPSSDDDNLPLRIDTPPFISFDNDNDFQPLSMDSEGLDNFDDGNNRTNFPLFDNLKDTLPVLELSLIDRKKEAFSLYQKIMLLPQNKNEEIVSKIEILYKNSQLLSETEQIIIDYKYAFHSYYYNDLDRNKKQERIEKIIKRLNYKDNGTIKNIKTLEQIEILNLLIFRIVNAASNSEFKNKKLILDWIKDLKKNFHLLKDSQKAVIEYQEVLITDKFYFEGKKLLKDEFSEHLKTMFLLTEKTFKSLNYYKEKNKDAVTNLQLEELKYRLAFYSSRYLSEKERLLLIEDALTCKGLSINQYAYLYYHQMLVGMRYKNYDSSMKLKLTEEAARFLEKNHDNFKFEKDAENLIKDMNTIIAYNRMYHTDYRYNKFNPTHESITKMLHLINEAKKHALNKGQIEQSNIIEKRWQEKDKNHNRKNKRNDHVYEIKDGNKKTKYHK